MRSLTTLHLEPPDNTLAHTRALPEPFGLKIDIDCGLVLICHKRGPYVVRTQGQSERCRVGSLDRVSRGDPGRHQDTPRLNRTMQAAREIRAGY
jgi:hypothetical protein